jgi:hypothetical protein
MAKGLMPLTLEALGEFDDGRIGKLFDRLLQELAVDCGERPTDARPRKLRMTLELKPVGNEEDVDVQMEVEADGRVPPRRTRPYRFLPGHGANKGKLLFNVNSPDNPHQTTLLE